MLRPWLLLVAASAAELDLSNWMGQLAPVLGSATVLDLSVPGAHDTMTFDLSTSLSDGYEGLNPTISALFHAVTPLLAGHFTRHLAQTQGLNITQLLDAGVRYIDYRVMYSTAPDRAISKKDWYCLHGCQTEHKAIEFLQEMRRWLDAHPKEILVIFSSRHGNLHITGTKQFPATTPAERQAFWSLAERTFEGLLFDSRLGRVNETSVATLWQRGQRVLWYAGDWAEFTNSSPLALDSRLYLNNELPDAGPNYAALDLFRRGAAENAKMKAADQFKQVSIAAGPSVAYIEDVAKLTFLPDLFGSHKRYVAECVRELEIPQMGGWCPMRLMDLSTIWNFYNQRTLEAAYTEGATNLDVDFPQTVYLDAIDVGGLIRTGTALINPLGVEEGAELAADSDEHATDGYAFAATLFGANVRRLCRMQPSDQAECARLLDMAEAARARNPLKTWNDPVHGRLSNWPAPHPPTEQSVLV